MTFLNPSCTPVNPDWPFYFFFPENKPINNKTKQTSLTINQMHEELTKISGKIIDVLLLQFTSFRERLLLWKMF